ncbi:unnamed protein product [Mesocestoides corti]|uniref:DUF2489 domain-containing protein n=1 Tax=Mesocestoides corti TaxID=53468 RepID=A0A0R3U5P9_MESCO|nr:unnamed protein product [Mesocestoides corti]
MYAFLISVTIAALIEVWIRAAFGVSRRGLATGKPSLATLVTHLQEVVDRWPVDTAKGHRDVRIHLQQRARDLIAEKSPEKLNHEADCLERLTKNVHRDLHHLPQGLGGAPPVVAATGLNLQTISTVLANKSDAVPKASFFSRVMRFFS